MDKSSSPTFHGFPVNTNLKLVEGDTVVELEGEPLLRVDRNGLKIVELREKIRYIISRNLHGTINIRPGSTIEDLKSNYVAGKYGPDGTYLDLNPPLYVILNHGFTDLVTCTPVKEVSFEIPAFDRR